MGRPRSPNPRKAVASVRLSDVERASMEDAASCMGFTSISDYVRHLHNESQNALGRNRVPTPKRDGDLKEYIRTARGTAYAGDALQYMHHEAEPESVDLVLTSPPFGLVRKKSYGNEDADAYCDWFRPFAEGFKRILKPNASLVIDIGGAWKPGTPTRSLYHFELLIMLCREFGFHLCQEHYWWNPSKLPSPAEWVNVRRTRVKDAVNSIWWLSPTPWPKASNRRVLAPYSDAMRSLLKTGYRAKLRPSGHDISENFSRDNGGSVPPNVLAIANTESNGRYQSYCREKGLPVHPARFPALLPEYFIRFLTDVEDLVFDPFAGSCVTGAVAEALGRRWVCTELSEDYLSGARARFDPPPRIPSEAVKPSRYSLSTPCANDVDDEAAPLAPDGGLKRPQPIRNQDSSTVTQDE